MASESSFSLIDTAQLSAIATGMSEIVLGILADFRGSFGEELKSLSGSESESTASDWQDFFHRVKGSGGTLGLATLQAQSASHEAAAKENEIPTEEEQSKFTQLIQASCEEAQTFLEGLS